MSEIAVPYTRFTFFWSGPFSQWHLCRFTIDKVIYNCAEQYMMAEKARLFGDEDSLCRILAAGLPRDQKSIGRRIKGFSQELWDKKKMEIVYRGNRAKFTTHRDLLLLLFETEGTELVEASPLDTIWGVGLTADDPAIYDRDQWRGQNLLGGVLTQLRDSLLSEQRTGGIPELAKRVR